ncbi:aldehyde dehydrogenase family protein [Gordonia sp. L191]|uniref:aldehyde dehydrogenase family protein n=1 Tax=Gordonia sp. L191 TaxID=2982699 RepID=UPI0032DEEAA1
MVNPSSGEQITSIDIAGQREVDLAVRAARRAFDSSAGWAAWPPSERADVLRRFADEIESRADQIATTVTSQNGMPIGLARTLESAFPALLLRYYAGLVEQESVDRRDGMLGGQLVVRRVPTGVVAAIAPWNYPQTLSAMKYAPALAAGCTVVLKAPVESPLDARLVAHAAIAAGLPAGVLNIVAGGVDAGKALVAHPGVDKVAFTGSTKAGREIARTCGEVLRPFTLELGGNSAGVILDDADLAGCADALFGAIFINNGQTCFRSSRILAPESKYAEVVELLAELARSAVIGDPLDTGTAIGPLINRPALQRVAHIVERASQSGRIVTGGRVLDRPGYFLEPTVIADIDPSSPVWQDEVFGPVVSVHPYSSEDHAIALANDSVYGLGGTVWSADHDHAVAMASRIHTGTVGINGYVPDPAGPFGGMKNSGIGREFAAEGLANFRQSQTIYLG